MMQEGYMDQNVAIEVENVYKKYRIYQDRGNTLKELSLFSKRRKYEEKEVLRGVSFTVNKGSSLGLIGQNGCGKSTTLKLLTRIIYPDSGRIKMHGRVSSLLELGAGFHPDMSGRENIYINAAIFGLTKKEIDNSIESIISFAELGNYIDSPVRLYSSGMYMRLAFAVAINVKADILLIDEILAVGDAYFQRKCFDTLSGLKSKGVTVVIVTHDMTVINDFCDEAIWLDEGVIREKGSPNAVTKNYLEYMDSIHLGDR